MLPDNLFYFNLLVCCRK